MAMENNTTIAMQNLKDKLDELANTIDYYSDPENHEGHNGAPYVFDTMIDDISYIPLNWRIMLLWNMMMYFKLEYGIDVYLDC